MLAAAACRAEELHQQLAARGTAALLFAHACPLLKSSILDVPRVQVREQGESAAVLSIVDALTGCLAKGGCAVVPGLSSDHYAFTLGVSMAGGLVAGAACKLEPTGAAAGWVGAGFGGWVACWAVGWLARAW